MSEYTPIHRRPVPVAEPLSSLSVELLQHAALPGEERDPLNRDDYVAVDDGTFAEDPIPAKQPGVFGSFLRMLRLENSWNGLQRRRNKEGNPPSLSSGRFKYLLQQLHPQRLWTGLRRRRGNTVSSQNSSTPKQPGVFRILFRTLQMDTVWNGLRRLTGAGPQVEEPKQAKIKSIPIALVSLFAVHFLPLSGALVLLAFNFKGYYVGGELQGNLGQDDLKLSVLQFAAKAHEVAMQASLAVIIIALVRHDLVKGDGVPFGAIFGSLQFTNVSYLISKEFVGMLSAKLARPVVKARLVALLFSGAVLAITVGPSSAIAMRPRLDDWEAGGTDFYLNATAERLWPLQLNASDIPKACSNITADTMCPARHWDTLSPQILSYYTSMVSGIATLPEVVRLNGRQAVRDMYTKQSLGLYHLLYSATTVPMVALADPLADNARLWAIAAANLHKVSKRRRFFVWRKDVTFTLTDIFQPGTATQCVAYNKTEPPPKFQLYFPRSKGMCEVGGSGTKYYRSYILRSAAETKIINDFYENRTSTPQLKFLNLPQGEDAGFGRHTMGAIVSLPSSWPGGSQLYGCIIDARWAPATIRTKRSLIKSVTSEVSNWPLGFYCRAPTPSIQTTPEWMQYLNPNIQDTKKTVFHTLVESLGDPPPFYYGKSQGPWVYYRAGIETIISMLMTSALSLNSADAAIQGKLNGCPDQECTCGGWCLDMMPRTSQEFGYGGLIYNLTQSDISKLTKFKMTVDINGYAYNIKGNSMILSCTVLAVYCFLAVLHIILVIFKRSSSSTSFDTVSDVVSLAMQSQPTDRLKNTSAGIHSTKVFSTLVRIITTGEGRDHLELDFGDHPTGGDQIVEGAFYR